ncbi:hypothetical protein U1Q18_027515 [Sarracenia purpurea var. burkii]
MADFANLQQPVSHGNPSEKIASLPSTPNPIQASSRSHPQREPLSLTALFIKKLPNLSSVNYARKVFDQIPQPDLTLHNSLISAYSRYYLNKEAIDEFISMQSKDTRIDCYAVPPVLKSCSSLVAKCVGQRVHSVVINHGLDSGIFVQTSLIDFYAKVGNLDAAKQIFTGISDKDPAFYNRLISGFSKSGDVLMARKLFDEMEERTLVSWIISKDTGFLKECRKKTVDLMNFLRDVISWNSMIMGLAINGFAEDATALYEEMREIGVNPDDITFVGLLMACIHACRVQLGFELFGKMRLEHKIRPKIEHHAYVLDLLCRSGRLKQA